MCVRSAERYGCTFVNVPSNANDLSFKGMSGMAPGAKCSKKQSRPGTVKSQPPPSYRVLFACRAVSMDSGLTCADNCVRPSKVSATAAAIIGTKDFLLIKSPCFVLLAWIVLVSADEITVSAGCPILARSVRGLAHTFDFNSWQHRERGCPTRRAFRRVGTTDLDSLVTRHRLHSPFCDRRGQCPPTCIATTALDTFTSSLPVVISEEHCWTRRRIAICF